MQQCLLVQALVKAFGVQQLGNQGFVAGMVHIILADLEGNVDLHAWLDETHTRRGTGGKKCPPPPSFVAEAYGIKVSLSLSLSLSLSRHLLPEPYAADLCSAEPKQRVPSSGTSR